MEHWAKGLLCLYHQLWKRLEEHSGKQHEAYLWTDICLLGYRQHFNFKFQLNTCHFWNFHLMACSRLTLSWRRPLSYRNQSIDLLRKSIDWFLYDNGLRHERVKNIWSSCHKYNFCYNSIFRGTIMNYKYVSSAYNSLLFPIIV